MIKRRAPIQSVLAQRKLFAAGGMVAQQPAAQQMPMGMPQMPQMPMGVRQQQQMPMGMPMGMPMPQQMPMGMLMGVPQQMPQQMPMGVPQQQVSAPPRPQQMPMGVPQQMQQRPTGAPQGILASSRSLIDAVAADAVNPAGGNTLSMKKGGLASGGRGNLHLPPTSYTRISPDVTIPGYTSGGDLSGLPQGDIIALMHGGERPVRPQPQPEVGDPRYPPTPVIGQGTDRQNMSLQDWQKVVFGSDTRDLPFEAMAWRDNVFSPTTGSPGLDLVQGAGDMLKVGATGLSQGFNFASDAILDFATFLQGGDDSPVGPIPSETDYLTYAMQIRAVEELLRNAPDVKGVSKDKVLATISESAKEVVKQNPDVDGEVLSRVVAGMVRKEYDWQSEMFSEKERKTNEPGYIRPPGSDAAQRQLKAISGGQRFNREGFIEDPASMDEQQRDQGGRATDVVIDEATDGGDAVETAVETAAKTAVETAGGDAGGDAAKNVVASARADAAQSETTPEDNKKTMKKFKDEFMEAMPKYEGMTESEKGFLIAEAGLRVMAGQSPNAIKNIAEGLKGLGPELMKGAKEKRDWDRTVNLSAAKYALSNVKADRTAAAALAKERRARVEYVANKAGVDPRNGRKFKKGDVLPFTAGDVHDGILGKFAPGTVVLPTTFGAIQDGLAAANEYLNKGRIKYSDYQKDRKDYAVATKNLLSGLQMKLLLGDAAKIIKSNPKSITGATSFLKRATDDVLNAINIQEKKRSGYLAELKASDSAKYQAIMKRIGTKMITQILNEGNRTVSDADRKRVDELVGAYGDYFSGFAASEGALKIKLEGLATDIDFGIQESQASMDMIEGSYNNRLDAENYKLLQQFKQSRFGRFQSQDYDLFRIGEDGVYRLQRGPQ